MPKVPATGQVFCDPNGIRIVWRPFRKNRGATRPCDGFRSDCRRFGPEGSCRRGPPRTAEHRGKVGRRGNHVATKMAPTQRARERLGRDLRPSWQPRGNEIGHRPIGLGTAWGGRVV